MAAAEARTAWQRMANRYFVQEDAKRAPKFACCPSSASKPQNDSANVDTTIEKDHPALNFAHLNWNPSNLNLQLDTKWWLQVQPNFGYQELAREELHFPEGKLEEKTEVKVTSYSNSEDKIDLGNEKDASSVLEPLTIVSARLSRRHSESKLEGMKAATSSPDFVKHKLNSHECLFEDEHLMDWKNADELLSGKKDNSSFDPEPWVSGEKTEPWWKIADREELASFVAKRSLEYFDNCDLPRPQKIHISRGAFPCFENFEDGALPSSFKNNSNVDICSQSNHVAHSSFTKVETRHMSSNESGNPFSSSDAMLSRDHEVASDVKLNKERVVPSGDPSKDELLEALCHSQTRAREAEIAAQKAYNEKEHVIKLFFRQASHLFAYKQWLRVLQLEKLYLQHRIKEEQDPAGNTRDVPWKAAKADRPAEGRCKDEKKREELHPCGFCGFLVAFAVGFSLASAGLLLGWTLGCLLPV